jgi:hypothetical protein
MDMEKETWLAPGAKIGLLAAVILLVSLAMLGNGLLALFVVPAPNANTVVAVSGHLKRFTPPHPEYGDLVITLEDGRSYYVNRADEVNYFAWERLLEEVTPGDVITLTVVRPLAWRLLGNSSAPRRGPVAGVQTDSRIYMDPAVSAATWTSQLTAVRNTYLLLALLVVLLFLTYRVRRS